MKKLMIVCVMLISFLFLHATDLIIEKTDGSIIRTDISQIKRMYFGTEELTLKPIGINKGLLAYWPLDGNAQDHGGSSFHGTIHNCKPCGGVNGKEGGAMSFTGHRLNGSNGDHILLPAINFDYMTELTISVWVKETRMENSDGEAYIWFGDHHAGGLGIAHFYDKIQFLVNKTAFSSPFKTEYLNKWVHYTLVVDNGQVSGYINGEKVVSGKADHRVYGNKAGLARHWWSSGSGTSARFTGCLDEARVYNRTLSESEIKTLMQF